MITMKSMKRKKRTEERPLMKTSVGVNLPADTHRRLRLYCAVHDLSVGRVIAALIENYLECGQRFEKSVEEYRTACVPAPSASEPSASVGEVSP